LFSGPHEPDTFINQYLCHSERETSVTRKKQKSRKARNGHAFTRQVQPGAFDREIFDQWVPAWCRFPSISLGSFVALRYIMYPDQKHLCGGGMISDWPFRIFKIARIMASRWDATAQLSLSYPGLYTRLLFRASEDITVKFLDRNFVIDYRNVGSVEENPKIEDCNYESFIGLSGHTGYVLEL
jgi:hypothetical protein